MAEVSNIDHHFSIRQTRFFMKSVGMWYVDNKRDQIISNGILIYTLLTLTIAMCVVGFDCFYSWGDLYAITFNAPCTITVILELFKLIVFIDSRREVMDLNAFTEQKFWKKNYEAPDLFILNKCNKQSIVASLIFTIVMQIICWHYLAIPIVESMGKNSSERTLPFTLWFNFPFTETPYYEIAFSLQSAATLSTCICEITFSNFLFIINIYASGQFKILQRKLEIACDGNDVKEIEDCLVTDVLISRSYARIKACIQQHQLLIHYMTRIENLYNPIIFIQTLGSVLQLCFSGFQILLGVESSMFRTILSVEFFSGSLMIMFMYSWTCHNIITESLEVSEAAFRCNWPDLSNPMDAKLCKQTLMIIAARARKPLTITVGKFAPMSRETFTSVVKTSMSYFTILRQVNEEGAS